MPPTGPNESPLQDDVATASGPLKVKKIVDIIFPLIIIFVY